MNIALNLSDQHHPTYTRISEVGVTLRALLHAFGDYDNEIAQTNDTERVAFLRLEQEKTGQVYQKLMDTIDAAKEGQNQ